MKISRIVDMWNTRMKREEIYSTADYWNWKAAELEGDAVSMWPNNHLNYYYHREQMSLVERLLPCVEGLNVLDVGCGTGRTSRYLASRGARVVGIDFSAKAIEIAKNQSSGDNPCYRVQSIYDFDEVDQVDLALVWGVVTVAAKGREDLRAILLRIRRALKPGGRFLVCEPIHKGFLHRVLNMNLDEFLGVMNEAGFKIEEVHQLHFWPMRLCLCYVAWPRFVTAAGYWLGQGVMRMFGNRAMGDYKAICARHERGAS